MLAAPAVSRFYKDVYLDINPPGATPPSGQIAMSDINAAFGWGNDVGAYRGRQWFTPQGQTGNFPTGQIAYSDFYNKQPNSPIVPGNWDNGTPGQYNFTVPNNNGIQVQVWGSGGSGGAYTLGEAVRASGQETRVYLPNGEQVAGGGGGGGQDAYTFRKGGNVIGRGGGGGGAGGGNQQNVGGGAGSGGDGNSTGGESPAGGGRTGVPPNSNQNTPLYTYAGNWPGGGASGFRFFDTAGKYNAFGGGAGGGGYARSVWANAFIGQNIVVVIGQGGNNGPGVGANGRVYINWW